MKKKKFTGSHRTYFTSTFSFLIWNWAVKILLASSSTIFILIKNNNNNFNNPLLGNVSSGEILFVKSKLFFKFKSYRKTSVGYATDHLTSSSSPGEPNPGEQVANTRRADFFFFLFYLWSRVIEFGGIVAHGCSFAGHAILVSRQIFLTFSPPGNAVVELTTRKLRQNLQAFGDGRGEMRKADFAALNLNFLSDRYPWIPLIDDNYR